MYEAPTAPVPRRRGGTIAIVLGAALAACCAGGGTLALVSGALSNQDSPTASTRPGHGAGLAAPDAPPPLPGLNAPVRDGKFEFVVTSVSCGHASVGQDWFRDEPQGQFCIVELRVTNIGTEAQRFADGHQKAFGPEGNLYAADTGAGVVANGNGDAIWNVVNPGNGLTAKVVFDIPPSATIDVLELHDSPFSGGVKVRVDGAS